MRKASRFRLTCSPLAVTLLLSAARSMSAQGSCDALAQLQLAGAVVLSAGEVPAGGFLPPGVEPTAHEADAYKSVPRFCRVVVEARPSTDSAIAIEVWLPVTAWNGKLRGQGNGGFAGSFDYGGLANSVRLGYASAATDAGHRGKATDSAWALHHPEKVIDFGYRAVHQMTGIAKNVIRDYYRSPVTHAYFDSCSDGGREALMEAQRFPEDYDGILAGAPANAWTRMLGGELHVMKSTQVDPAALIPATKLPAITSAALRACDSLDGSPDGILDDPRKCQFDPASLLCKGSQTPDCLSAPEVRSAKRIYAGGLDLDGKTIFPGLVPSSEAGDGGWKDWVTGNNGKRPEILAYTAGFFQNMVYEDPQWDYRTADVRAALDKATEKLASVLDATDPNLSRFQRRGGKLILYHGWLDPAISPLNTIEYYNSVVSRMGEKETSEFVRLYMIPGMRHCAGGPGPFVFGQLGMASARDPEHNVSVALEEWVEKGHAPGVITGTKFKDDHDHSLGVLMTRPLCPFDEQPIIVMAGKEAAEKQSTAVCSSPR